MAPKRKSIKVRTDDPAVSTQLEKVMNDSGSGINEELTTQISKRAEMKRLAKEQSAQIKNTKKRKARILRKAQHLQSNDLLEVYLMRRDRERKVTSESKPSSSASTSTSSTQPTATNSTPDVGKENNNHAEKNEEEPEEQNDEEENPDESEACEK